MRKSTLSRAAIGALALAAVVALNPSPANAWVQGTDDATYYMPGPPPGPYQGACIVTTGLHKYARGDTAVLTTHRNAYSSCRDSEINSIAVIVTFDPATGRYDGTGVGSGNLRLSAEAVGPTGQPVIGAHWTAYNDYGPVYWDTTAF
jgi:hypothetical protein